MNNDLISREALKKALSDKDLITYTHEYGDAIPVGWVMSAIDNVPTAEVTKPQSYVMGFCDGLKAQTYEKPSMFERPQGDLISREALINVILNDRKLDGANANWEVNRILVHIDNAPTVEEKPFEINVFLENADEETLEDIKKELNKVLDKLKERNDG